MQGTLSATPENPDSAVETSNTSAKRARIRLLLVEDDPGDALLLKEMLADSTSKMSFEIEIANSMAKAVSCLQHGGFDLVLCDLALPDTRGIETFTRIRECCGSTPVIVLSGADDEELASEIVERGAQDYLVKGHIDSHLLVRAIRYALKRVEAEKALADEHLLLRNVINAHPDSIYVKDRDGRYILDNVAHLQRLNMGSMDEVVGKTVFDFFSKPIAEKFDYDDKAVMDSGNPIVNFREPILDDHGNKYWFSTTKVPLRDRDGKIIGLVGIGRDITQRKRAEEQAALYNEQLRHKNAQMEDDLRMASEIQQAFLPLQRSGLLRRAAQDSLRFHSTYLPTGTVGGDFFDILPLSDTTAGVFISDVMGHGVRAALVTALQRALVEELADAANDPGEFLSQINRALMSILKRIGTPLFVSAFYLFIDVTTREIRYSSAGHPKPILIRRSTGIVENLSSQDRKVGPALGVFSERKYETFVTQIAAGDLVLLFTDGLFEVEGPNGELFDQTQLLEVVRKRMDLPPEALSGTIIEDIKRFSGTSQFSDDVCVVLVDFDPRECESQT